MNVWAKHIFSFSLNRAFVLFLFFLMINSSCFKPKYDKACDDIYLEDATLTSELTYDIFKRLLESFDHVDFYHILQQTNAITDTDSYYELLTDKEVTTDNTLIQQFINNNQIVYLLKDEFEEPGELINNQKLFCIFNVENENQKWDDYYSVFKNSSGLIEFTRPAINSDKSAALIVYALKCGSNCGIDYGVLLEKNENEWDISRHIVLRSYN